MKLRTYQQAAVDAVYDHLRNRDDNPVAVLPTGAGKSPVLAKIASDAVQQWNGRVLILAHFKELLEQNADKVRRLCPGLRVGLYSAGLKKRDTNTPALVAGIQSVYRKACDLAPFDLVIVDEAHLISKKGDGMYRQFLADCKVINPNVRVINQQLVPSIVHKMRNCWIAELVAMNRRWVAPIASSWHQLRVHGEHLSILRNRLIERA